MDKKIRIGTRGSPLALKQTAMVKAALLKVQPDLAVEEVVIKTTGDWRPEQGEVRLEEASGGKRLFAKEIEEALLAGTIDAAVHSMKDMDSALPAGLVIHHMLEREDARDAVILGPSCAGCKSLEELPAGLTIGTASIRRQAFLLARRPDLKIVPLRGNVGTRLEKVKAGQVDATLLAMAGLKRLELEKEAGFLVEIETIVPCAGQGAVGIEIRGDDEYILAIFGQINHAPTALRVAAERAALLTLDGSCRTPIGAHAIWDENGQMDLRLAVASADGREFFKERDQSAVKTPAAAEAFGRALAERLKLRVPLAILRQNAA